MKFKTAFNNYKQTASNFFYFSLLRLFNISAKFFLIAYLVRILGEEQFGLLSWSDSILQYFIIVINFGFNIYGARYIVEHKNNQEDLNKIISTIYCTKGFFLLLSFLAFFILIKTDLITLNLSILVILVFSTIGDMLFPVWYFQGAEKLKPLTIVVAISKFLLLLATFLLIKNQEDLNLYAILFSLCQILMGILGYIALKKDANFTFIKPKILFIKSVFKKAILYFLGNISMLVFNALTIFLIGFYISLENVTGFDISLKIVLFALLPFDILQAVLMPVIVRSKSKKILHQSIILSFIFGLLLLLLLYAFPDFLLNLFGGAEIIKYKYVLNILSLLLVTVPTTFLLGQCGLVAFGKDREYNFSLIITAIMYILIVIYLIASKTITFERLIYLRVLADYFLLLVIGFFAIKEGIIFSKTKEKIV